MKLYKITPVNCLRPDVHVAAVSIDAAIKLYLKENKEESVDSIRCKGDIIV